MVTVADHVAKKAFLVEIQAIAVPAICTG